MSTYTKYCRLNMDTALLGLAQGDNENNYFCTPKGVRILGWAGVDGIHYCFIRGFGEMVFAVSPMNEPGNYVHPLAKDFADFLRLLLACGNTAALDQAYRWDQARFDAFLMENPRSAEQQSVLDTISEKLQLTPMAQPFAVVKALQATFDYSKIKFTEDYEHFMPPEPQLPPWQVYFDGNFWGHHGKSRAGTEVAINKQFVWHERVWYIPAINVCSKGLVIDFCIQVPRQQIQAFIDQWHLSPDNDGANLTHAQQMQVNADNPLTIDFSPKVILNDKTLCPTRGYGLSWNPCFPAYNDLEAKGVLNHYGLDPAHGWVISRSIFPWATTRKPKIASLSVTLKQDLASIPGLSFQAMAPGDQIPFTHPTTGVQHTLTVQEYEPQQFSSEYLDKEDYVYPTHYTVMSYTISPDLPDGALTVIDCGDSDQPQKKHVTSHEPQGSACIMGFMPSSKNDDMTIVLFGDSQPGKRRTAVSRICFNPVDSMEWLMVFHEKTCEDITVTLI